MAVNAKKSAPIPVVAVLLAWLVPGFGHVYLGRPVRGVVIFLAIALTFWSGIAMGGVMTVDPQSEKWWFIGDMLTGVHGLVGWERYRIQTAKLDAEITKHPRYEQATARARDEYAALLKACRENPGNRGLLKQLSDTKLQMDRIDAEVRPQLMEIIQKDQNLALVSPLDTVARAYCGIVGLLNLMVIFDALMLSMAGIRGETPPEEEDGGEAAAQ